jgi:hypothetical protein
MLMETMESIATNVINPCEENRAKEGFSVQLMDIEIHFRTLIDQAAEPRCSRHAADFKMKTIV